jgi:hypothetical protein
MCGSGDVNLIDRTQSYSAEVTGAGEFAQPCESGAERMFLRNDHNRMLCRLAEDKANLKELNARYRRPYSRSSVPRGFGVCLTQQNVDVSIQERNDFGRFFPEQFDAEMPQSYFLHGRQIFRR